MQPGKILILNGTSSSGKTSILEVLQTTLDDPYLNAGLDKFIWMLPTRYLDRPLWDQVLGLAGEAGPLGHRLVSGMHHGIAALSRAGNNVLADHVLVEPSWVRECADTFAGLPAHLIGVRCPLEVVEEREKARRDRTLGQARIQFDLVHAHGVYDLEVDTSVESVDACAERIKAYICAGSRPSALRRLRQR
jgi:chloramphenicol 3-O phosphotransferase